VISHDGRWTLPTSPRLNRPNTVGEAEISAGRARELLGLDGVEPFLNATARVVDIGLLAFSFDLGAETADAASILLAAGGGRRGQRAPTGRAAPSRVRA
jgi:hypothetical protein